MRQSFWHLTGNLWALALSTVIALYLPPFGPENSMDDGVGVVIRTTIVAPIVFSLLYWGGRLIYWLAEKLIDSLSRLLRRWRMSIITAGFEEGRRNSVERRAKKRAAEMAPAMAAEMAPAMAAEMAPAMAREMAREMAPEIAREMAEGMAQERAEEIAQERIQAATEKAAEKAAKDKALAQEATIEFMRSQGVSDEEIDAFFCQLPQQG